MNKQRNIPVSPAIKVVKTLQFKILFAIGQAKGTGRPSSCSFQAGVRVWVQLPMPYVMCTWHPRSWHAASRAGGSSASSPRGRQIRPCIRTPDVKSHITKEIVLFAPRRCPIRSEMKNTPTNRTMIDTQGNYLQQM